MNIPGKKVVATALVWVVCFFGLRVFLLQQVRSNKKPRSTVLQEHTSVAACSKTDPTRKSQDATRHATTQQPTSFFSHFGNG